MIRNMRWFDLCQNGSVIPDWFTDPPPLDPFCLDEVVLMRYGPSVQFYGHLPAVPDKRPPRTGRATGIQLFVSCWNVSDLTLSGWSKLVRGSMTLERHPAGGLAFSFASDAFRCGGRCESVTIDGLSALSDAPPEPPGPRVFSHYNVWNTCLLLLREKGFTAALSGSPDKQGGTSWCKWHATAPGRVRLEAANPVELLGLAALHDHHKPDENVAYWWRIDGPNLLGEAFAAWERRYFGIEPRPPG